MTEIQQGHIYFADLNPIMGHEQGGYRPVLILQKNMLNRHLSTVVVAPLTKNLKAMGHLTTCFISKKESLLPFDSVALLFQLRTIDKKRLKKFVSALDKDTMAQVREQIFFVV
ncbi:type II toxin-antitoxin system PemK/MazF family toxin [Patescibacteria group bacterium]|nr:type II toxin-antitoxin system PemK/MazF family toxin [Patescibacteria group bacterium]MBU1703107.1 type II toxin-antitoxin system PemK/MazF family toxin [Patescibacteria group bacterium]MBU1953742.1 type II toxin-antitoxin system PemK/MazF family toxin [Patescibacteria group bacterium]